MYKPNLLQIFLCFLTVVFTIKLHFVSYHSPENITDEDNTKEEPRRGSAVRKPYKHAVRHAVIDNYSSSSHLGEVRSVSDTALS